MSAFKAILAKDLRTELRTLEAIPAMALFAATTFVLFRFGLDRRELDGSLATGVLLVTILFAAILAINRVFDARAERLIRAARTAYLDGMAEPSYPSKSCPICGKPAVERFRPFCSGRCKDVDLNRWFSGAYAIPAAESCRRFRNGNVRDRQGRPLTRWKIRSAGRTSCSMCSKAPTFVRSAMCRMPAMPPDRALQRRPEIRDVVLTTEEEGMALAAGAWLGGQRAALLMQSSGVGNCINMLSLIDNCRFPFLTLVTMRGEWAEFNPWQVPMSQRPSRCSPRWACRSIASTTPDEVADTAQAAIDLAFGGDMAVAVMLSQNLIGSKDW